MKLEDLNKPMSKREILKLAEVIDDRLVDARLLLNQRDTARLLGITPRALSDWPVAPIRRVGRQKFYFWPDVLKLAGERHRAQLSKG